MIVVAVCKGYHTQSHKSKVTGKRIHYAYPCYKAYYYDENGKFKTKYLHGWLEVLWWKLKVHKMRHYRCEYCGLGYTSNMKRCPRCGV